MSYNVGQALIDIAPNFAGFANAMDAEVAKAGDRAGSVFADAFKVRVDTGLRDMPIGPSDEDSTRQGAGSAGKFADAFKARLDAALKSLPKAQITADSSEAEQRVAEIRAQLETLRNQKIGIDISDADALAKIAELQLALKSIGASSDSARIKVDTSEAIAQLVAFKAAADAAGGSGGGGLLGLANSASSAGAGISNLATGAAFLGPALIPVVGTATAGFVGLSAMITSAGLGLGAFALGAGDDFNQVDSVLKETLADFQQLAQPVVLPVIDNGLALILPIFSQLMPLVDSTASELTHLEDAGEKALNAPFWRGFITFIDSQAGPSLNSFATLAGGVGKAFAGASVALGPEITQIENDVTGLGDRLANWGANLDSNTGFQHFLAYVETEGPVVGHLLENLGGDVSELISDLAPAGAVLLSVTDGLAIFLKDLEDLHAGPINLPELAIGAILLTKFAGAASSAALWLKTFNIAVTDQAAFGAVAGGASGLEKLVASLGGLSFAIPEVLVGLGLGVGIFAAINAASGEFDDSIQKVTDHVEGLPANTLPQLQAALKATNVQIADNTVKMNAANAAYDKAHTNELGPVYDRARNAAVLYSGALDSLHGFASTLNDDIAEHNKNLDILSNNFGISRTSAEAMAKSLNIDLNKGLSTDQLAQFNAGLQQQASQAGLTKAALEGLAATAHTSSAQIASEVSAATQAATTSWASFGDVVTKFSSSTGPVAGSDIAKFFETTETQGAQFATNIQKAIADGYDPTIISQIAQAGPAQAAQLLQGLVSAQGTGLNNLITQAESALTKEGAFAIEEARLTQEAVSSKSSATAAQLGSALAISQALTSSNVLQSVETVISHLSGGYDEFELIASNYGIALPASLQDQLVAAGLAANAQTESVVTSLGDSLPGVTLDANAMASAVPDAFNALLGPAATAALGLSGAAKTALDSNITAFLSSGSASGQDFLNGILSSITGGTTLKQITDSAFNIGIDIINAVNGGSHSKAVTVPTPTGGIPGLTLPTGPGHAAGLAAGPIAPGVIYPVGERGPEWFMSGIPGQVLNERDMNRLVSSVPAGGAAGPVIHQENHFAPGVDRAGVRAEVDQSNAELLATLEAQGTR